MTPFLPLFLARNCALFGDNYPGRSDKVVDAGQRFEQQDLTLFFGLVLFQSLFARLGLYRRLARCFRKPVACPIYPQTKIMLLLIIHMLLGLRESRFYGDDPIVL